MYSNILFPISLPWVVDMFYGHLAVITRDDVDSFDLIYSRLTANYRLSCNALNCVVYTYLLQ